MWVVIPVKRFAEAKTRLSGVLSDAERESFAQVMLNDVLSAIAQSQRVRGVMAISQEVRAKFAIERLGGLFIPETSSGLSNALMQARTVLKERGIDEMLMIPGDVPLVSAAEIDRIVEQHARAPAVTIVPDREESGTNALAVSPADLMPFSFGLQSLGKHTQSARDAGVEPHVLRLPGIGLDIDNPLDLRTLLAFDNESESLAYLTDSGIARRILPHEPANATRLV
ncbi:MAG: 2-phospho-L-lactate guanylyltransferase [Pseudomonadota bacterium]